MGTTTDSSRPEFLSENWSEHAGFAGVADWQEPSGPVVRPRTSGVFSTSAWAELLYVLLSLAPAITVFVLTVTLLAVGVGLTVIYVGLPILALGLLVARAGGHLQRIMARVLLGLPVSGPPPIRRRKAGPIGALTGVLTDPGCWRAASYHWLNILLAPVAFGFAVGFYSGGLGGLTYWFWRQYLPLETGSDGTSHRGMQWWSNYYADTPLRMTVVAVFGVLMLLAAPRVVRFFTTIDRLLITGLLGGPGRG